MRAFPFPFRHARSLPGGGAKAGEEVGCGDHEDQGRQPLLVVVPDGLVPDRVGDRVRLIGYTGDGLGEREGGAFGVAEGGASRQAATAKSRSSVSPASLRRRECSSTQALQPLIWLTHN